MWRAGREQGIEAARILWLAHPMFEAARENPAVWDQLTRIVSDYSGWHLMNDDPGIYPDPPDSYLLETITAPTLAIIGERDIADFHVIADTVAQRVPKARKVMLHGVGHMCNMEDPAVFNEVVLDFLDGISSLADRLELDVPDKDSDLE